MTQVASGKFVAQHLQPLQAGHEVTAEGTVDEERIQPNGVDIGIAKLWRVNGRAVFKGDDYDKPDRTPVYRQTVPAKDVGRCYCPVPGSYIVKYDVKVEIPDGYVGHVYPRSRLMRSGINLVTALWDQGYEGVGEGLLQIPDGVKRVTIPADMPVAQMTFQPADSSVSSYDGTHQQETLSAGGVD